MVRRVVGVMGGAHVPDAVLEDAQALGRRVARNGWVLLTGGRAEGVMDAASRGAHAEGGLVVGVLPGRDRSAASRHLDVALVTGLGDARNAVNVLSSDAVVVLPGGAGTLSEMALAVKAGRPVLVWGMPVPGSLADRVEAAADLDGVEAWLGRVLGSEGP